MGYTAQAYYSAWEILTNKFGKPSVIVRAQLQKLYSHPPVRHDDSSSIIKFSSVVTNVVNVLEQLGYHSDLQSEGVLGSATRKLSHQLQEKWLLYLQQNQTLRGNLLMFRDWLSLSATIHQDIVGQTSSFGDRNKFRKDSPRATSFVSNASSKPKNSPTDCPLCQEDDALWKCETFRKQDVAERRSTVKKLNRCFLCLRSGHISKDCSFKPCDINDCGKNHSRMLHDPKENSETVDESETSKIASSIKINSKNRTTLPVLKVRIRNGDNFADVWALSDSGSTISLIDETLMNELKLKRECVNLSLSGINKTENRKCCKTTARIESLENDKSSDVNFYSHSNLNVGNQFVNARKLKSDNPKLYKDIRGENYNLRDVKIVLGQDCYKLHHASETSFIPGNESLPMKATSQLGVALCGAIESKYTIEGNSTIAFTSINEVRKSEPD